MQFCCGPLGNHTALQEEGSSENVSEAILVVVGETSFVSGRFCGTGSRERRWGIVRTPNLSHRRVLENDASVWISLAQVGWCACLTSRTVASFNSWICYRSVKGVS